MPINLAPYLPAEPDQGLVPAAFNTLIHTILKKKEQAQQQQQFEAEQAQLQSHFDTTEKRLTAADEAEQQIQRERTAQAGQQHKDAAAAKRRDEQVKAAEVVSKALQEGKGEETILTMKPYLTALGISAEVKDSDPVLVPGAFRDPTDMGFAFGPRKLVIHADGQPLGDIDLDHLQSMHREPVDKMFAALVAGASPMDRPGMKQMTEAASASPRVMADPVKAFGDVTSAAATVSGQAHGDQRAQLGRDAATANANATRTQQANRYDQNYELRKQVAIGSMRDKHVKEAMDQGGAKELTHAEQAAKKALGYVDAAMKTRSTLAAGSMARAAVATATTAIHGKNSSNLELKQLSASSLGNDAEAKINYYMSGGEMPPEQLAAVKQMLTVAWNNAREQKRRIAASARDSIWGDSVLQGLAGESIQTLGQEGANRVLGSGEPAQQPQDPYRWDPETMRFIKNDPNALPGMPGSAIQNQADELRGQDDGTDAAFHQYLSND